MTVKRGPWTVAVSDEWIDGFTFQAVRTTNRVLSVHARPSLGPVRASIEVRRTGGGLVPHALLGGELGPASHSTLEVTIPTSGPIRPNGIRRAGLLASAYLVPGLPDEFLDAVVAGIRRQQRSLVSGHFRILQAGYDPVESSSDVFRRAAALLVRVLVARTESYTSDRLGELVESLISRS